MDDITTVQQGGREAIVERREVIQGGSGRREEGVRVEVMNMGAFADGSEIRQGVIQIAEEYVGADNGNGLG